MKQWLRITLQFITLVGAVWLRISDHLQEYWESWYHIFAPLLTFIIFAIASKLILEMFELIYRRREPTRDPKKDNFILGLRNVYYILFAFALLLLALSLFGIDYRTLFTSLSIVAAAIAIVTREFLTDILSGIFMSFSENLRIDDYVRIGEVKGKVLDMGLQKITFLNDDDDVIYIPNYKVYSSEITNFTRGNQRRMSIDFQIAIDYVDDVENLERDMVENLKDFHKYVEKDSYNLKIVNLTKDFLDLKFQYTMKNLDRDLYRDIRRKAARRVLNFVKAKAAQRHGVGKGPTQERVG